MSCGEDVPQGVEGGGAEGADTRGGEGGKEGGPTGLEEVDGRTDGTLDIFEGRRSSFPVTSTSVNIVQSDTSGIVMFGLPFNRI